MLRFTTAGESHGPALVSILEGMPAGLALLAADVDVDLVRRQQGYGRGRRMQIEQDAVQFLSGVRAGETLGSPIAMLIPNRDWKSWHGDHGLRAARGRSRATQAQRHAPASRDTPISPACSSTIAIDARDILERASARETTARVAAGAICRKSSSRLRHHARKPRDSPRRNRRRASRSFSPQISTPLSIALRFAHSMRARSSA